MKPYIFLLAFFPCFALAQPPVTIDRDTLIDKNLAVILSNDSVIREGSVLICGHGTLPDGSFKYIHSTPPSQLIMMSVKQDDPTPDISPLNKRDTGMNLQVRSIKKQGHKDSGYRYVIKVGGHKVVNYTVELEDAIAAGEIIGPNVSRQTYPAAK
jgi:hypothetical protein